MKAENEFELMPKNIKEITILFGVLV
jgi:hypothetical protein